MAESVRLFRSFYGAIRFALPERRQGGYYASLVHRQHRGLIPEE